MPPQWKIGNACEVEQSLNPLLLSQLYSSITGTFIEGNFSISKCMPSHISNDNARSLGMHVI